MNYDQIPSIYSDNFNNVIDIITAFNNCAPFCTKTEANGVKEFIRYSKSFWTKKIIGRFVIKKLENYHAKEEDENYSSEYFSLTLKSESIIKEIITNLGVLQLVLRLRTESETENSRNLDYSELEGAAKLRFMSEHVYSTSISWRNTLKSVELIK